MKKNLYKAILFCAGLLTIYSCLDPYNPSTTTANPSYLVVDGFLNATQNSCTIKLSRTIPISSDSASVSPRETKAQVKIEDENGTFFILSETDAGEYNASNLNLNTSKKYRIRITTTKQKIYLSDFVPIVQTPPIDSITHSKDRVGVHINVNTHDANNNTHYYKWSYAETWIYTAAYDSELIYVGGEAIPRVDSFYKCWKTISSSDIIINSSAKLLNDVVDHLSIAVIPWQSPKLKMDYSILVEQRSLTKGGYEYWQQLKKNTESLGTLFDPLPSKITGNISCVTNGDEPVIGYFSAAYTQSKRIFIHTRDIIRPPSAPIIVTGYEACQLDSVFIEKNNIYGELVFPFSDDHGVLLGYLVSTTSCVNCRLAGGTTVKPDFWK